jgi:hypothetical protein
LEGSNDGLSWVELDQRANDPSLNAMGATHTFCVAGGGGQDFRMIRLRQTGTNSIGHDYLQLTAMEFFGDLKPQQE